MRQGLQSDNGVSELKQECPESVGLGETQRVQSAKDVDLGEIP